VGQALLLTGRPGVGKTTVVRKVVAQLGSRAGGFYTEEVRERGQRIGFRLVALNGPVGMLASVNESSPWRVGKYKVNLHDLEQVGVEALKRAVQHPQVSLVVIDEIGKMELFLPAFRQMVLVAIESPKPVLGTVMARAEPWVDAIKIRVDVILINVTPANREALPEQILRWVREIPAQAASA
jgi:nucleoside-triphosphatase